VSIASQPHQPPQRRADLRARYMVPEIGHEAVGQRSDGSSVPIPRQEPARRHHDPPSCGTVSCGHSQGWGRRRSSPLRLHHRFLVPRFLETLCLADDIGDLPFSLPEAGRTLRCSHRSSRCRDQSSLRTGLAKLMYTQPCRLGGSTPHSLLDSRS
jgi:hypothetical protein